jgi:hypothetical protein
MNEIMYSYDKSNNVFYSIKFSINYKFGLN